MTGWTPLYQQIVASSIWGAPDHVRLAWITLLAVANKQGIATITEGGLARLAVITRENAANALQVLSEPDPDTLTQENQGRRIERVENGWKLLNFHKYRDLARSQAIKEQNAMAQAKYRAGKQQKEVNFSTWNNGKADLFTEADTVYDLYPLKVGKKAAINKIVSAIKNFGLEKVLEATKTFAATWQGENDLQFCPHPATWYGQHRFNDDPATWVRKENKMPEAKASETPKDTFWKDKARLELVENGIHEIEGRASHTAMDIIVEARDVDRYAKLKAERKELKTKMNL